MMLSESLFLRETSSKMDQFPTYMEHSSIEEETGLRRFLIMQFIDKSLNEYISEKYPS